MIPRSTVVTRGRWRRRAEPGAHPGKLVADPAALHPRIEVIRYDLEQLEEREVEAPAELAACLGGPGVTWVNVEGLRDVELLAQIGEIFGLHALALEDVVNAPQRPKVEAYEDQLFIVLQMVYPDRQAHCEQLSLFLGGDFLLTFREGTGGYLEGVRERLRTGRRRLRKSGPDYLTYALLDAVIDHYFPVLEAFEERLEEIEDGLRESTPDALEQIDGAREELRELRRAILPVREVTRTLLAQEWPQIRKGTRVFLRDCNDHVLRAAEQLEVCREIASGLMAIHLSTVSNQANETMKVLTIIATIFMPLSFIAGIYGMNFNPALPGNMPELNWPFGYVWVLGGMAAVGIGLVIYFRRKGWF